MPSLQWIGKDKVVHHHLDVPFHILEHSYGFVDGVESNAKANSGNKIIHGDNLVALKSLLPEYEGKVNCIYIDPPYNTGEENWVYNDNVNDPKIKKWLGEVVGKESEDLTRHDKWLCMMYPRLKLLHKLLSDDGVIFISIDDNEVAHLKILMDEVFGSSNFVGTWFWFRTSTPPNLSHKIKKNLEYVVCYEKIKNNKKYKGLKKESKSTDPITKPQNSLKQLEFPPNSIIFNEENKFVTKGIYGTSKFPNNLINDLIVENFTNSNLVIFENRFVWTQNKLDEELANQTKIYCSNSLVLSYKKENYDPEVPPNLIDSSVNVATTEEAGKELIKILGEKKFDFPKPKSLIEYLSSFIDNPNSIILDSFAGSGTTAHAVLNLNKKDGGNRKFILVEMEEYANSITAERVKRVIKGYADVEGCGGSFDYYTIGEALFTDDGLINETAGVTALREYIYFTETQEQCNPNGNANPYFLGSANDCSYYFFYIPDQVTTLNAEFLSTITLKSSQYVIYADTCALDEVTLLKNAIIFKKIPRDITRI